MHINRATYQLFFFFLTIGLLVGKSMMAQKRALNKPIAFLHPLDTPKYAYTSTKEKEKAPWIVMCDQDKAQTFEQITKTSDLILPKIKLKFKDWFYVSEEKDCCIKLFKGKIKDTTFEIESEFIDYGWIEKKNMLLWTSCLIDEQTNLRLKGFSTQTALDIATIAEMKTTNTIKIYNNPYLPKLTEEASPYQIYFIFKQAGNRYLVAKKMDINPKLNTGELVGWVEKRKIEIWNTNILVEPNFDMVAFLERQNNPNFEFVAYAEEGDAKFHSEMGQRNDHKAVWTNDPATKANSQFSTQKRRFTGGVIRFPILNYRKSSPYFRSGLIGQLTEETTNHNHPEDFAPAADEILFQSSNTGKQNPISTETLDHIIKQQYRIYTEVFIPKKIKGATYPTYSLVLFMSERQLEDYIDLLDLLSIDLMRPDNDLRKGLYLNMSDLVKTYTTYKTVPEHYQLNDLKTAIQGITQTTIDSKTQNNFVIKDILSSRKMPIEQIRTFANNLVKKIAPLKIILQNGKKQEFNTTSRGNTYFWIPLEYIL